VKKNKQKASKENLIKEKEAPRFKRILSATRKHIVRNKWLSIASTIVIALTFIIATSLIGLVLISSRTISSFEKKAQVMVFFQPDTAEEDIREVQKVIENTNLTEDIEYISKDQALEIYKQDFEDDPELVESVTADSLPPSLGIRAKSAEDIPDIIKTAQNLKEENNYIDEVMYFQDVIDTLRSISSGIRIGGTILIGALSTISIVLILITIGFNINAHKHEIEVMQLVGSTDSYIKTPFLLEGAAYGFIGSTVSTIILIIIWYAMIYPLKNNDLFFFFASIFKDINMEYLLTINPAFIAGIIGLESIIGTLIGLMSSSIAIWKYLK
jgi:cell division transport system permease protein